MVNAQAGPSGVNHDEMADEDLLSDSTEFLDDLDPQSPFPQE